jgi:hypothetical protein
MWTPNEGATIYWTVPGGTKPSPGLPVTAFTNTGSTFPNHPDLFWARYSDGEPIWVEEPNPGNPAGLRAHLLAEGDHGGVSLGTALMRAAEDPGNPWGLEPRQMQGDMQLLIHDFMATELGPGREDPRVLYPAPAGPPLRPGTRPSGPPAPPPALPPEAVKALELVGKLKASATVISVEMERKSLRTWGGGRWAQNLRLLLDLIEGKNPAS